MKANSKRASVYSCGYAASKTIVFVYRFTIKMAWMPMNDIYALLT